MTWMDRVETQRDESRDAIRADLAELRQHTDAAITHLRQDVAGLKQDVAGLKQDVAGLGGLREEMRVGFASLRQEMAQMEARFERRFSDLIKWSFVFWVGAVAAVALLAGVVR